MKVYQTLFTTSVVLLVAILLLEDKLNIPENMFWLIFGIPILGFSLGLFYISGMMGEKHKSPELHFVPMMSPVAVMLGIFGTITALYLIGTGIVRLFH